MVLPNVFFFLKAKNEVTYLYGNTSFKEGLALMRKFQFTAMPVIDEKGAYLGSISEGDFLWFVISHPDSKETNIEEITLKDLLREDYMPPCKVDVDIDELFSQSLEQNFVPIVDDRNIFIGIVTRRNILSYFVQQAKQIEPVIKKELENQISQI